MKKMRRAIYGILILGLVLSCDIPDLSADPELHGYDIRIRLINETERELPDFKVKLAWGLDAPEAWGNPSMDSLFIDLTVDADTAFHWFPDSTTAAAGFVLVGYDSAFVAIQRFDRIYPEGGALREVVIDKDSYEVINK